MKRLLSAAALLLSFAAHAQTTVNLSPFTPAACEAAKTKLADTTLVCADKFTPAPIVATLTLSNLPEPTTTARTAKIDASVTPAALVWCRLDNWAPIACPQTFSLGAVTPLAIGPHKVDYYVGATFDVAKPTRTYSWTITAPTVPPVVTPPVVTPPSASALPPLTNGSPIVSSGGASITDSTVNGTAVATHRITKSGALIWGGTRAERAWTSQSLKPGADYWWSFAVQMKPGESVPTSTGVDDDMLVMQTHTPAQGATSPDLSLMYRGQDNTIRWGVAYNTKPSNTWQYVGGSNPDTEGRGEFAKETMPKPGVWTRFVVHYRPGYLTSHKPKFEVWRATAGADFTQTVSTTMLNTYNSLSGPSYPRIGPYKWTDSIWKSDAISFVMTPLYFGEGTDLLEPAKAAVAAFR